MPTSSDLARAFEEMRPQEEENKQGVFSKGLGLLLDTLRATSLVPMSAYSGLMGGLVGAREGTPLQSALKAAWQTAQASSYGSEEPAYGYADYLADMGLGEGPFQQGLGTGVDIAAGLVTDPLAIAGSLKTGGMLANRLARVGQLKKGTTTGTPNIKRAINLRGGFEPLDKTTIGMEAMQGPLPPGRQLGEGGQRFLTETTGSPFAMPGGGMKQLPQTAGGRQMPEGLLFPEIMADRPLRYLHAGTIPGNLSEPTKRLVESFGRAKGPGVDDLVKAFERIGLRKELVKSGKKVLGKSIISTQGKNIGTITRSEFDSLYGGLPGYPFNTATERGARHQVEFLQSVTTDPETKIKLNKITDLMDQGIFSYEDFLTKGGKKNPSFLDVDLKTVSMSSRESLQNEFLRIGQLGKEKALEHFRSLPENELRQIASANRQPTGLARKVLEEKLAHYAARAAMNVKGF